jgi:hypothetical protein
VHSLVGQLTGGELITESFRTRFTHFGSFILGHNLLEHAARPSHS